MAVGSGSSDDLGFLGVLLSSLHCLKGQGKTCSPLALGLTDPDGRAPLSSAPAEVAGSKPSSAASVNLAGITPLGPRFLFEAAHASVGLKGDISGEPDEKTSLRGTPLPERRFPARRYAISGAELAGWGGAAVR